MVYRTARPRLHSPFVRCTIKALPLALALCSVQSQASSIGAASSEFEVPAALTIISQEQIENSGATTLAGILSLAPGVHSVFRFPIDDLALPVIRGITAAGNLPADILVMVDGVPLNDIHLGTQRWAAAEVPLYLIERVEVIRGPYSTLYGTDAFAGVVNIVTKTEIEPGEGIAGLRVGSWDTREARVATEVEGFFDSAMFGLDVKHTDGPEPFFARDTQSLVDGMFGTSVSHAPGNANTYSDSVTAMFKAEKGDWSGELRLRAHEDGSGGGLIGALDPNGEVSAEQANAILRHQGVTDWTEYTTTASLSYYRQEADAYLLPPGTFGGAFAEGAHDVIGYSERHARLEHRHLFVNIPNHWLQAGVGYEYAEVFNVTEERNYAVNPQTGQPAAPLPGMVTVPEGERWTVPADREIAFAYVQDEWAPFNHWSFVGGVRVDHYSDFGTTVNPRVGAIYTPQHNLTMKLIHGTGFRAPTTFELYAQAQPSTRGNANLDPVRIESTEFNIQYRPLPRLTLEGAVFEYEIEDMVVYEPAGETLSYMRAVNGGEQTGWGGELSASYALSDEWDLSGYYAYQQNKHEDTGTDVGFIPRHKIKVMLDGELAPRWHFTTIVTSAFDRERPSGSDRPAPEDYTLTDVRLSWMPQPSLRLALDVRNVFDQEVYEVEGGPLDQDVPLPGRAWFATGEVLF